MGIPKAEQGIEFSAESNRVLEATGFDAAETRRTFERTKKKGQVWGLQDPEVVVSRSEKLRGRSTVVVTVGEIDGWPLDPSRYDRDGKLIEDEQLGNNGNVDTGFDISGMVPGGVTGVKVNHVPESLPPYLNLP